ncbi:SDR family oxidoreductase [Salipiger sp. IMCC34102]|uniref:SDR family NAD(P)-dependent oxidoreductase n=1 Tax=Salipiger sp. IMCC34102 TaxID=2510647 RepID=UPI00101D2D15|nr:SDR family oxidoreductase [Salipiger sp. IMCC34102]RYH02253.1 SDR family oxidoreductase [Salipiger sp. IMCC34102]
MSNLALVTGASSGIGRALAQLHAAKKGDLILVARSGDTLAALAEELRRDHGVRVEVVAADLGDTAGVEKVMAAVRDEPVEILINNAGFGGHGAHLDRALEDEIAMVDLNVKALMTLTHAVGGQMAASGRGRILNVGSTAGMMPGPMQAVYFATKAFVRSYSLALSEELRPRGVTVTVLAPGYVGTGFADRADLHGTQLTKGSGATPESVAKVGYEAMMDGKLHVVNERALGFALNWIIPLLPHRLALGLIRRLQSKG